MKIAIDIQGCQSEISSKRGIGRYSLNLIKAFIRNYPHNQYYLFANAAAENDIQSEFIDELYSENLSVNYIKWYSPSLLNDDCLSKELRNDLARQIRSYMLAELDVDIFLITSFFEGFLDNSYTGLDFSYPISKVCCIFYDLIPLLNPKLYLINPEYEKFYNDKLIEIRDFDFLLAISKSARFEAIKYLEFEGKNVFNILSACDDKQFNNLKIDEFPKFNDLKNFILYTGAVDPRKNLKNLIKAYASLPIKIIVQYKLVIAGSISESEKLLIFSWCNEFNLPSNYIKFLGYVSDEELCFLYRNCFLYVFPSFHEGFGLPVLEAMSCGAAVIGSNTTSIPEVIQFEDALFNPFCFKEIASLIEKCLTNKEFYSSLKDTAIERSRKFSWEITSKLAYEAILNNIDKLSSVDKELSRSTDSNSFLKFKSFLDSTILQKKTDFNEILVRKIAASISLNNIQIKKFSFSLKNPKSKFKWEIQGPFDSSYSLAIVNRSIANAANKICNNISIKSTEGFGDFLPSQDFLTANPILKALFEKDKDYGLNSIITRNLYPPRVSDFETSKLKLMHAYGWEESEFPFEWVQEFNTYLDGITVMSRQVKKILIDNGVSIPIEVCHLGVDHIVYDKNEDEVLFEREGYKFLHISSCFPRKGISFLLQAYGESFSCNSDVTLIIKTFENPHNNLEEILLCLQDSNPNFPHVQIINDELSSSQIKFLYNNCDCLVAPSLGEGFGLPIGEAMLNKLPVITTAWGGQMDFCNSENCWLVDYKFNYANTHFNLFSSVWAEPIIDDISRCMEEIYSLDKEKINEKVEKAKLTINEFTWEKVVNINLGFFEKLQYNHKFKNALVGFVTPWNQKCGIFNYSQYLLKNFDKQINIFAPNDQFLISKDENFVNRCWLYEEDQLDNLLNEIIQSRLKSLVIQFNFGFFNLQAFANLIKSLKRKSISIIIIFHSTKHPANNKLKELNGIAYELSLCDRLLVHSPNDLNNLKAIGLVSNTSILPHGVNVSEKILKEITTNKHSLSLDNISIASFGYCLPDKGFDQLILACKYLNASYIHTDLYIYSSLYGGQYQYLETELNELIHRHCLEDRVKINFDYLTEDEITRKLQKVDLIVYPYQSSNESSSAAVRNGLKSGTPIAITPLDVFQDVEQVAYKFSGFSASELSSEIKQWHMNESKKSNKQIKLDKKNIARWLNQFDFRKIALRLESIIESL